MAENVRPPVAIQIVRPYDSEDELLEHELETIGKTSVVLIGAHPRPTGVILRFEVTLASGTTVLRGEGRVLAHKENAFRGQPGLTLRFTRLDPRSKSVVNRATAMREARGSTDAAVPSSPSRPAPVMPSSHVESPVADALTASTPAPGATAPLGPTSDATPFLSPAEAAAANARAIAREKANATARANAKRTGSGRPTALTPPPAPARTVVESPADDEPPTPLPTPVTSIPGEVSERPRATAASPSAPEARVVEAREEPRAAAQSSASGAARAPIEPPADRADLLARLRERAGKLPPERVEEILSARR